MYKSHYYGVERSSNELFSTDAKRSPCSAKETLNPKCSGPQSLGHPCTIANIRAEGPSACARVPITGVSLHTSNSLFPDPSLRVSATCGGSLHGKASALTQPCQNHRIRRLRLPVKLLYARFRLKSSPSLGLLVSIRSMVGVG